MLQMHDPNDRKIGPIVAASFCLPLSHEIDACDFPLLAWQKTSQSTPTQQLLPRLQTLPDHFIAVFVTFSVSSQTDASN